MRMIQTQKNWLKATRRDNRTVSQRRFANNVKAGMYSTYNQGYSGTGLVAFSEATIYGAVRRIDKELANENKGTTKSNDSVARTGNVRKFNKAVSA